MKSRKALVLTPLLISFLLSGCSYNNKTEVKTDSHITTENKGLSKDGPIINNISTEDIDNSVIAKRYEEVKKEELAYEETDELIYYYETKDSFVGEANYGKIPNLDNRKYKHVLKEFTYASEINPTKVTYEEALRLASKVLPTDIKELRKKYDNETGHVNIVYSTSKGNFILSLAKEIESCDNGVYKFNDKVIVGISYMKEIK